MSKTNNKQSFNIFNELEKLVIIYVLVLAWPSQKGSDYSDVLELLFNDITKKEVNRILYKYIKVFNPNLNHKKVPAWTVIINSIENEFPISKRAELKEIIKKYTELFALIFSENEDNEEAITEDKKNIEKLIEPKNQDRSIFESIKLRDWQQKIFTDWLKNNKKGYVIASRRTGKTFLAQSIAKDHALNIGPVIVLVNTVLEIEKWKIEINSFNKEQINNKFISFSSNTSDLLKNNTILVNTFSNLSRIKFKNENILLIVEHLETLNKESGELLNQEYKYRLAFANSKPEEKFIEKRTNNSYFGIKLIDYSFTESWLDEFIQKFKLNFVPCKIDEDDQYSVYNLLHEVKNIFPEIQKMEWLDLYKARNNYIKNGTDVFFIDELIELFQTLISKTDYIESKISNLKKLSKSVIFCENSYGIKKIHKSLDLAGVNHLIYSNNPELYKLSQSPNSWRDEKVLITDHIEYFTNYELGEIEYSIILGCAGNSNHLKAKIESIISDKNCHKELVIDVLYAEGTWEDPYQVEQVYHDFRDYLRIENNSISKAKQVDVERKVDLDKSKILIYCTNQYIELNKHLDIVSQKLNLELDIFKTIKINSNQNIIDLYELIDTRDYSDGYIVLDKNDNLINDLNQIDKYSKEIKLETRFNENANLANLFKFVYESNKYKFLRKFENKS